MKFIRLLFLVFCFLSLSLTASFGQTYQKDSLFGSWRFVEFLFTGELASVDQFHVKEANDSNNGLVITFSMANKFKSYQKGGKKINNSTGTFKFLPQNRLVIMGDTLKIVQLDKYLKLYSNNDRPIIVFKRL